MLFDNHFELRHAVRHQAGNIQFSPSNHVSQSMELAKRVQHFTPNLFKRLLILSLFADQPTS